MKLSSLLVKQQIASDLKKVEAQLDHVLHTGSEDFNALIRPLSAAGGKRLRASLFLLIARAGQSEEKDRIQIATAIEMLHLATLIHDDVLDQAELRRGVPAIHCSKGNKVAILSGDYLFAKAFDIVADVGSVACLKVFSYVISSLVEGEFLQMEDVFSLHQGVDRYLSKTQKKTADFIEGCMELGGIIGHWDTDKVTYLKQYGHALGMAFQVTDDIMDYRESTETTGKPVGKDVKEGILTYPLLSIVSDDTEAYLEDELQAIKEGKDTKTLLAYVRSQGGLANTLALEASYREQAVNALDALPDFAGKAYLYDSIDSLAQRKV